MSSIPPSIPAPIKPDDRKLDPRYQQLADTLDRALEQAARGKGAERHGSDKPWSEQPVHITTEAVGLGFPMGQAMKKIIEAKRLWGEDQDAKAVAELLGAINYIAAAVQAIEKG